MLPWVPLPDQCRLHATNQNIPPRPAAVIQAFGGKLHSWLPLSSVVSAPELKAQMMDERNTDISLVIY